MATDRPDRRRRSPVAAWAIIAAGVAAALALLLAAQRLFPALPQPSSPALQAAAFYVVLFAPLALLAILLGIVEHRPIWRAGRRPGTWGSLGLACGIGGLATCVAYVWLHGDLRPVADAPAAPPSLALGVGIAVLTVAAEELLFRGWLLPALVERAGLWLAVLLSAAAFSGFHLVGGISQPYSLVNLMLGGVWFALLACRSGGLIAPFAAHFGWNVAEDLGLGLVPNPGRGEFGAVLDRDIAGPVWWGGSDEGLNASVAMTVVLLALILPLLASRAQRSA